MYVYKYVLFIELNPISLVTSQTTQLMKLIKKTALNNQLSV